MRAGEGRIRGDQVLAEERLREVTVVCMQQPARIVLPE